MKKLFIILSSILMIVSCSPKAPEALILYYSQTGSTQLVAAEMQKQLGVEMAKFDVEEVYDGDYQSTIERCIGERESGFIPTLAPLDVELAKYDVIYLGFPVWFGEPAPAVKALIASGELSGKKIVPFCTFGSGGLQACVDYLKAEIADAEIADGFGIRSARVQYAEEELDRFLIEGGYKEGTIEALPEFAEPDEVIPEERALYDEAVAGYPYYPGEPYAKAARTIPGGVEFIFFTRSEDRDGKPVEAKVYVSRINGRNTEFTQVVR